MKLLSLKLMELFTTINTVRMYADDGLSSSIINVGGGRDGFKTTLKSKHQSVQFMLIAF